MPAAGLWPAGTVNYTAAMGKRLSKIVTRTGDAGETGLATGARLAKTDPRIAAIGEVAELNSHLGVLIEMGLPSPLPEVLREVQNDLFDVGGELSMPGLAQDQALIREAALERLEADFERINDTLPPLTEFVLPGGTPAAAQAHVVRAVCRRVERALWAVPDPAMNPLLPRYLNRLSDLMFAVARQLARIDGGSEVMWRHSRQKKS